MKRIGIKKIAIFAVIAAAVVGYIWFFNPKSDAVADSSAIGKVDPSQLPVKGMVTMIDLGADSCVPCKMMAPILKQAEEEYRGRAAIVFLDVWKNPSLSNKFGIKAIPTQIFYDQTGKEVYRHEGFLSKKAIDGLLKDIGVI